MQTMARRRWRKQDGSAPFVYFLLAMVALGVGGCVLMLYLSGYPPGRWRFIAAPPLPPGAANIATFYPSNEVERITEFVTDQPVAAITEFYRTELATQGWTFQCRLPDDSSCELWSVPIERGVVEVYRQAGRGPEGPTLSIFIASRGGSASAGLEHAVTIRECCLPAYR
jgi:hypothetical protein